MTESFKDLVFLFRIEHVGGVSVSDAWLASSGGLSGAVQRSLHEVRFRYTRFVVGLRK